jgi:nitrogen fixation protein FixH
MTIIALIWRILTQNPVARAIGAAMAGLLALWAYGASKKREGASAARSEAAANAAKETIEAHEVRNEVENRIARERDARDRLRGDWSE